MQRYFFKKTGLFNVPHTLPIKKKTTLWEEQRPLSFCQDAILMKEHY